MVDSVEFHEVSVRYVLGEPPGPLDLGLTVATPDHARDIGVAWAADQVEELLDSGAPSAHFFVLSSSKSVDAVLRNLDL
ncbi:MAG: methylenetetrahydrofolate reductase [Actinomycetia bacterium]|nr:methylenetetrahydrofolate reductase [Actinomycetes bacterium]